MRRILLIAGLVVFATGIVVGFQPLRSHDVLCGSVFKASSNADTADYQAAFAGLSSNTAEGCKTLRTVVRYPTIVLLFAGFGLMAGGMFVARVREDTEADAGGGKQAD